MQNKLLSAAIMECLALCCFAGCALDATPGSQESNLDEHVDGVVSNGLVATYFDNMDLTTPKMSRVDATVNFDWGQRSPGSAIGANTFSVRWKGFVKPRYSQTYTFTTRSDDGVRLWVNNKKLIDNWTAHPPTYDSATIALQQDAIYPITLEYYENFGGAVARLLWSSSSQSQEIIPSTRLFTRSPFPTVHKMEQGQAQNRVHLALIGDGYTSQELSTVYAGHVQSMLAYMFSSNKNAPYPRYKKFVNRYRIDIASPQSGVDNPEKGIYRNTALGGEATCSDYPRTCQVNFALTHNAINSAAASSGFTPHWRLALLNNDTYANGAHWVGAPLAVYSARCPGWWDIRDIALHEGAHTWHGLADEYIYENRVWPGGPEPNALNVTANSSGSKWSRWLGYKMRNGYTIGAFEGASGYEFGLYRPSFSSKMNGGPGDCHHIGNECGHNMIGIEKIIQDIYKIVRPVDSHRANNGTLVNPGSVWVKVVDPDVIKVDWYVNGVLRVPRGSQTFLLKNYITAKGTYQITANCYDEVVEHANSDNKNPHPLDLVRSGLDKLKQTVSWTVRLQ